MITASTGRLGSPAAIRAELPSTIKTNSPSPAPTISKATNGDPSTSPAGSAAATSIHLPPSNRRSLTVATATPTTFAIRILASSLLQRAYRFHQLIHYWTPTFGGYHRTAYH